MSTPHSNGLNILIGSRQLLFPIYPMLLGGYYYPRGDNNIYLVGQVSILLVTGTIFSIIITLDQ